MSSSPPSALTQAILDLDTRGEDAADRVLGAAYDDLRALARRFLGGERADHTLQPTALVNEACLRLLGNLRVHDVTRSRVFALAATAMRRVLVDHARRRLADKRGGAPRRVTLTDSLVMPEAGTELDVLALEDALTKLGALDPRQARIVELRFFAGLTAQQAADALGISRSTVHADWEMARAFLARELDGERAP